MTKPPTITLANERAYKASIGQAFPHMGPHDAAVWRALLETGAFMFQSIRYDVAVGGKAARRAGAGDQLLPMWKSLLAKRIDVLAQHRGAFWVTEVKPTASMSALGQALTYAGLWKAEHADAGPARPVVVCSRVDDDVEEFFILYGVLVIVVSPASESGPARIVKILGEP